MISADWISLPIIFSNLVKSSMTDSEVVVLTVLVLGGRKKNGIEYETITRACISYQSPWTNLLGTKGILRRNRVDSPSTHILICWKQLLRLPRLFVLLELCLPICNWLKRTYGRAGRLCLRPECYPRSNSRTKLKSLLIPAHACYNNSLSY